LTLTLTATIHFVYRINSTSAETDFSNTHCDIWFIPLTLPLPAQKCPPLGILKPRLHSSPGFNCVCKKSPATFTLTATRSYSNVWFPADASSSQADGVGASCWVVDGRAGGLGHGPLIPHLLPVVAAPEPHCDIIIPGYGDGLLEGEEDGEPGEHPR